MRCLVVEDDFVQRKVMSRYLQPFGDIDIAVDGAEALTAHDLAEQEERPYDLILLDIRMPGMDGTEVLARLRERESAAGRPPGQGAKIVMTTSVEDTEVIKESFRKQCDAYLIKPILRFDLLKQLRELGIEAAVEAP